MRLFFADGYLELANAPVYVRRTSEEEEARAQDHGESHGRPGENTHTQIKVGFMATQMIVTSALALVLVTAPRAHASLLSAVRQRDARSRQQPARNRAIHSNGASYWRLRARRRRAPRAPGWLAAVSAAPEGRGGGRAADVACSRRSALRGVVARWLGLCCAVVVRVRGGASGRWCVRACARTCAIRDVTGKAQ